MIDIDWKPNDRKLRQFAVASLVGFPLIGFMITRVFSVFGGQAPANTILVGAIIGAMICVIGLAFPRAAFPIYVALVALALPIGLVLSFILIPLIYYGVFAPVALGLKLCGKDPMRRDLTPTDGTYWQKRKPTPPPSQYFKQY